MNIRLLVLVVASLLELPVARALPQASHVVVAVENFQGGLPSHWSAQKIAALNLDVEIQILLERANFSCHIIPYDNGYRVLWIAPSGVEIERTVRTKISKFIENNMIGAAIGSEKK